jgi:uncharacterized membrane protein YeaQ/YmgE (transglycosylase-associated protein family)
MSFIACLVLGPIASFIATKLLMNLAGIVGAPVVGALGSQVIDHAPLRRGARG